MASGIQLVSSLVGTLRRIANFGIYPRESDGYRSPDTQYARLGVETLVQAEHDWQRLVDGALPCNNGKGIEVGNDGPIYAKPTPEERKMIDWMVAHPDLSHVEKDAIMQKARRASCQRGAAMMFPEGEQRAQEYRSCMALKGY